MGEKKEREKQRESQAQGCGERQAEPRTTEKHRELEARSPEGRGGAEGLPLLVEGPQITAWALCWELSLINVHLGFPTA